MSTFHGICAAMMMTGIVLWLCLKISDKMLEKNNLTDLLPPLPNNFFIIGNVVNELESEGKLSMVVPLVDYLEMKARMEKDQKQIFFVFNLPYNDRYIRDNSTDRRIKKNMNDRLEQKGSTYRIVDVRFDNVIREYIIKAKY
jgi:hypothetical protein